MAILESEEELENFIVRETESTENDTNPLTDETIEYCFRQVDLGPYGTADIIFFDVYCEEYCVPELYIRIIELKKGDINLSAIAQISRYKTGLEYYIENKNFCGETRIEGILVGAGYDKNDGSCFLVDSIDWLDCYHYKLSLTEGITFEQSAGWMKENAEFSNLDKIIKPIDEKLSHEYEKYKASLKGKLAV